MLKSGDDRCVLSFSHKTGQMTYDAPEDVMQGQDLSIFQEKRVRQVREPRNIRGDQEFIVKLQPPVGNMLNYPTSPWMCYDGPVRSFSKYIDPDTTGLREVFDLLKRDGIKATNPLIGLHGVKGYFMAQWEGSCIRVFYDRLVPPQNW
mmetsp:Transcript_64542/g.95506  ORF Transcript_64542/g.95506 Transcript_64542/m.95506 type:complete len:148 (+) Transcript_64542:389-832(+)